MSEIVSGNSKLKLPSFCLFDVDDDAPLSPPFVLLVGIMLGGAEGIMLGGLVGLSDDMMCSPVDDPVGEVVRTDVIEVVGATVGSKLDVTA